ATLSGVAPVAAALRSTSRVMAPMRATEASTASGWSRWFPGGNRDARVTDPMFQEADQPLLVDRVEERPNIGVQNVVHLPAVDPDVQGIQRVVRSPSGPKPVGEPKEVFLVEADFCGGAQGLEH